MGELKLSKKGQDLIALYEKMAIDGYDRVDETHVDSAFNDFELRAYRGQILPTFKEHSISTVLDYGSGGSNWEINGFDEETGVSAIDYFGLKKTHLYEPARDIDERQPVDCVVSFDVLEHIFISDVPAILRDMLSYATTLVVINVACYPAAAKLPNGENAHITVRPAIWWKGMVDSIVVEYPKPSIMLICSTGWRKSDAFSLWSGDSWQDSSTFVVDN